MYSLKVFLCLFYILFGLNKNLQYIKTGELKIGFDWISIECLLIFGLS